MATARDIINRAFRLIGNTDSGESSEGAEYADALQALNDMLAAWSGNQALTQYSAALLSYTAAASVSSFTVGPTGNLVSTRPYHIDNIYLRDGSVDSPIEQISSKEYGEISLKSLTGSYATQVFYDPSVSNGRVYCWPGLSAGQTLFFEALLPLQNFASLSTVVTIPDNYSRALAYNLAVEIAPEYGVEASPTVQRIAGTSKVNIKRTNADVPKLMNEASFLSSQSSRMNIVSGR